MTKIILVFISILLVFGCKNPITQPNESQEGILLHKTYTSPNTNTFTEYFYNDSSNLEMVQSFDNGDLARQTEYEYNGNQNIVKVITFHNYFGVPEYSYSTNEYNGQGLLTSAFFYLKMSDNNYELRSVAKYEYDSNQRLNKSSILTSDSVEVKYTLYIYDENGNIIETNFYQNGSLSFNDKYEYDNMNNPLKQKTTFNSIFNISPNNVVKHSQINYMMGNDQSIVNYSYQYNNYGYPISCSYGSQKYYYNYY